jgi:hypothetical protein
MRSSWLTGLAFLLTANNAPAQYYVEADLNGSSATRSRTTS